MLVTAYDIIFFWVARMIFSGLEHTGKAPFHTVYIHGLIRDGQGRKFSKSLGNGIDPLDIIKDYGADALRFMLVTGNSPGNDMRFYVEEVLAARNFANKIWNAARFAKTYLTIDKVELPEKLEIEDKWILNEYNKAVKDIRENLDKYELGVAAQKLYDFIWDKLCDWYIELIKPRLFETNTDKATNISAQQVLCYVLTNTLALLHPFMPFVTEEIWQSLPHDGDALIVAKYPEYSESLVFDKAGKEMENVMALIKEIRRVRKEMDVPASKKTTLFIETDNDETYKDGSAFIQRLASASEIVIGKVETTEGKVGAITADAKAYMPLGELIDIEKERARLQKEIDRLKDEIERVNKKLSNEGFVAKAPQNVIDAEKQKREGYEKTLQNTEKVLDDLLKL